MGLKDLQDSDIEYDEEDEKYRDNSKSKSSGGSSSSDGRYPRFEDRVPYVAIWEGPDGELKAGFSPQEHTVLYIKESSSKAWRPHAQSEQFERYWMDQYEWKRVVKMVQDTLDLDLIEIVKNDPEEALRSIKYAARNSHSDSKPSMTEKCPVCRTENHVIFGEFTAINGRRVCKDHTTQELVESGFLT